MVPEVGKQKTHYYRFLHLCQDETFLKNIVEELVSCV